MANIKNLLDTLITECRDERAMFRCMHEREFFIETVKAESLADLLEKYNPAEHNASWEAEYQKPANQDIDVLMREKRAVDFMSAGRLGQIRHYCETELRANILGAARMNWDKNILEQTVPFVTKDYAKT